MNKKKVIVISIAILYLLWHVFMLSYYPLPWFDETYFASISLNFMERGTFVPQVAYHAREGREALTYGPVYFFLTGLSQKLFGLGILQFRIVNLLFGLLCILASLRILGLKELGFSSILFLIVFSLDPFFNLSMHEGRMDLTALFFALLSLYFVLKNEGRTIFYSAISASLALMTTPRSAIIIIGVIMILVMNAYKDDKYKSLIQWAATFIALYALWLFYAFGGPLQYLDYYKALQNNENQVNHDFLGGRFYIPKQEYVLIAAAIFSIVFNLIKKKIDFPDMLSSVSIAVILLFYVIVLDWGPYSALIIPFYYILIFNKDEFNWSFSNPRLYILMILLVHNISYFTIKSAHVISSMEQRDPDVADKFIADHIPAGSKVVGDALYFYSVKKSGSDYQFFDKYASLETREQRHREDYNYDYIIITDQSLRLEPEAVALYLGNSRFKKIAELKIAPSEWSQKISSLGLISNTEISGYNAVIYLRIKNHEAMPMALIGRF
jgi:4-amino-4-deoxy-L-arabinose transferase-like glycosyltransferase